MGKNRKTNNLDARIRAFEDAVNGKASPRKGSSITVYDGAFHKPGSSKK